MPNQKYKDFSGTLKVLEKKNQFITEVEIWLLNGLVNRNKWRYTNVVENKDLFVGTPILIAYVNNGTTIGDGHNFRMKRDIETGEEYASFVSADSERIVGAMSEKKEDIRVETLNGTEWIVGKGFIWNWYAAEAAKQIEQDSLQGRGMSVSIETLVNESHYEDDVEVMDDYIVLGTTVLGHGVKPAVADAKVVALQEFEDEFKELKIRAASYNNAEEDDGIDDETDDDIDDEDDIEEDEKDKEDIDEPDDVEDEDDDTKIVQMQNNKEASLEHKNTKENRNMIFSKKNLAELQSKFEGYTVLAAEQTEDNNIRVCLMSADGTTYKYCGVATETIVPERIERINVNASFDFGEEASLKVDTAEMMDNLSAQIVTLSANLKRSQEELDNANKNIKTMQEAEEARRLSAAKEMAKCTLEKFNKCRECKVDASILNSIMADIDSGMYTNSVDCNGAWCGDKCVEQAVLAKCAYAVMEMDAKAASAKSTVCAWDAFNSKQNSASEGGVESLLEKWNI